MVDDVEGMTIADYQREVMRTHGSDAPWRTRFAVFALGISGEAGEVAEIAKKHLGHGRPLDIDALRLELGDVLWYVAALAAECGMTLDGVARANVEKLRKRYPNGFEVKP